MSFLGPVTTIDGALLRPHDVEILTTEVPGSRQATIDRVTRLGFEVRIDLDVDGAPAWAQVTRGTAEHLDLKAGDHIWVLPHGARTVASLG
jgi:sulfate transport system ATP-binding protein